MTGPMVRQAKVNASILFCYKESSLHTSSVESDTMALYKAFNMLMESGDQRSRVCRKRQCHLRIGIYSSCKTPCCHGDRRIKILSMNLPNVKSFVHLGYIMEFLALVTGQLMVSADKLALERHKAWS